MSANELIRHTPEPIEPETETEDTEESENKPTIPAIKHGTSIVLWRFRLTDNVAKSPYVNVVV